MEFLASMYRLCYNTVMEKNNTFKNLLFGMILGISNVIPGVSGGTMAVILNIYDKVLLALTRQNIQKNLPFLVPLLIGTLLGIYVFSHLITNLFEEHKTLLTFAFTGIILGSIPIIFQKAQHEKVKGKNFFLGILALAFMLLVSNFETTGLSTLNLEYGNPIFYIWILISSALAMVAMLLPGISGSLILLILGAYTIAMEAIAHFKWDILFIIALGVLIGAYVGVRIIQNMLRNHPQALYFIILGLVLGSVFVLFNDMKAGLTSVPNYFIFFIFLGISFAFGRKNPN